MTSSDEKLDELLVFSAVFKEQLSSIHENVDRLNNFMFIGNGEPSIIVRVAAVEKSIKGFVWLKRLAIASLGSGVVGVGLFLLNHLVS